MLIRKEDIAQEYHCSICAAGWWPSTFPAVSREAPGQHRVAEEVVPQLEHNRPGPPLAKCGQYADLNEYQYHVEVCSRYMIL